MQTNKTFSISFLMSALILGGCGSDNHPPELSGDSTAIVAENSVNVAQYTATDSDNDAISYSLSGVDNALFSIDANGLLTFNNAPDYENGDTGPYSVTIIASDNDKSDELTISVTVGDVTDTPSLAVVQTIASDYSNSEVVYIDGNSEQVNGNYYPKDASDYTVASYKTDVFHIGRYFIDTIDKYSAVTVDDRDTQLWAYSTQDAQDSTTRNPYTLISLNENKAYLLRYGSSKVWIVNPQATNSEEFKVGELDLSDYVVNSDSNDTPNPSAAVINNGKLFIVMQRQYNYSPNTTYVAVFDTSTDTEIETNANSDDAVKGVPLQGLNPLEDSISSHDDKIYISSRSAYGNTDSSLSRIEEIDTTDYSLRQVLNAGDLDAPLSFIKATVIVSPEQGYFYASDNGWPESAALYQFNPTTGAITASNIADTGTETISFIALDAANYLWVSVQTDAAPGIDIIDSATNEKVGQRLPTDLNPGTIRFIEE